MFVLRVEWEICHILTVSAMTYSLVIFIWMGAAHSVTHIDGYSSLQACQSVVTQLSIPLPFRLVATCISGPDRRSVFP